MNYSKKIAIKNIVKIIVIYIILIGVFFLSFNHTLADIQAGNWTIAFIMQLILFGVGAAFGIYTTKFDSWFHRTIDHLLEKIKNALNGNKGEKEVYDKLNNFLDTKDHTIYRNIKIPNKKFDIDILVLGPKGLTAFEIKNWKDDFVFHEKFYEKIKKISDYKTEITKNYNKKGDPRRQITWSCTNLWKYIKEKDKNLENIKIQKAVIFTQGNATWEGKPGIYLLSGMSHLEKFFNDQKGEVISKIDHDKIKGICDSLTS